MERCDEAKRFAEAITLDFYRISKVHFSFFFFFFFFFFQGGTVRFYIATGQLQQQQPCPSLGFILPPFY
jgi:hypothetical protein